MIKIQDIATLSNGINFGKSAYTSGIKLIGVSDFKDRMYPDYNSLQEVDAKIVRENDFLHKGDIVFVRSNGNKELVGRCMMINQDTPVTFSGFCIRLRLNNTQLYNPTFFTYLFKSNGFRKAIAGTAVGANIQNLSQGRLGNYEFECPNIKTQHRIATTLSRYDSLIDNYQKQIKLLEEAAQRLYKEWFVNLRFPGHENTKIVDGVPEGWEKKSVGDMLRRMERTKQVPSNEYLKRGEIPVIDQSRNFVAGYTNDEDSRLKVTTPVILFGDHTRVLKYLSFSFARGADGTQLIMSNDIDRLPQSLFYNALVEKDLSNYSYARHFKYLKAEQILVPTKEIAQKFDTFAAKIYEQIQSCRHQLRLLTESRDRLLPKLLSGEIEV